MVMWRRLDVTLYAHCLPCLTYATTAFRDRYVALSAQWRHFLNVSHAWTWSSKRLRPLTFCSVNFPNISDIWILSQLLSSAPQRRVSETQVSVKLAVSINTTHNLPRRSKWAPLWSTHVHYETTRRHTPKTVITPHLVRIIVNGITNRYIWMVRGSHPGVSDIFRIRPDRPWGPPTPPA
jgi:hypothetical protein